MVFSTVIPILSATVSLPLNLNPAWFWLLAGTSLCSAEFILPRSLGKQFKFVPLTTGICALILATLLFRTPFSVLFKWQVFYWMTLSTASVIWLRPMLIKPQKPFVIPDATEAKTLTVILPGSGGRVLYEGCNWQACCQDHSLTIEPNQIVYVLRREGNTLIVAPKAFFCLESHS